MPKITRATRITFVVLTIIVFIAAVITYELASPKGYYARQHSDLVEIRQDETKPYTDLEGATIDISDFQGAPLIINAWASWSPFTKSDHELLRTIKEEYGDTVTIIAMNRMETKETANAYLDTIGRQEGIIYLVDSDDHFFKTVEGYAMPETLFYDAVGNVRFHIRGTLSLDALVSNTKALIEEK